MAMYETLTFVCDEKDCKSIQTFPLTDEVDAYIELLSLDWVVGKDVRVLDTRRMHFCPEHKDQAK